MSRSWLRIPRRVSALSNTMHGCFVGLSMGLRRRCRRADANVSCLQTASAVKKRVRVGIALGSTLLPAFCLIDQQPAVLICLLSLAEQGHELDTREYRKTPAQPKASSDYKFAGQTHCSLQRERSWYVKAPVARAHTVLPCSAGVLG